MLAPNRLQISSQVTAGPLFLVECPPKGYTAVHGEAPPLLVDRIIFRKQCLPIFKTQRGAVGCVGGRSQPWLPIKITCGAFKTLQKP